MHTWTAPKQIASGTSLRWQRQIKTLYINGAHRITLTKLRLSGAVDDKLKLNITVE